MLNKIFSCLFLTAFLCGISLLAFAKDGWEGRYHTCDMASGPRLVQCQEWISSVKRPDTRTSCCGEADSFVVDDFVLKDGELFAIFAFDYYDLEGTLSYSKGELIHIPMDKINTDPEDSNKSSHGVVFINPGNHEVLCFFLPALT